MLSIARDDTKNCIRTLIKCPGDDKILIVTNGCPIPPFKIVTFAETGELSTTLMPSTVIDRTFCQSCCETKTIKRNSIPEIQILTCGNVYVSLTVEFSSTGCLMKNLACLFRSVFSVILPHCLLEALVTTKSAAAKRT